MIQDEEKFSQLGQKIARRSLLRRIWTLSGGISAEMTAFELEYADGQTRKMIRRSYGDGQFASDPSPVACEFRLLQITQALGFATPAPYYLDLSGEIFAAPYLVIEYIEGQMMFAPTDLDDYLHQLAAHLAQIHGADYTSFDLSFLPQRVGGCTERERKRPFSLTHHETRIRQKLASLVSSPQHNPSTLLHGDFWPGNSLWQDGRLVAVIDWEDAEWGDPLIDLAKSRSEIVWIFGVEAMNIFTHYYQALLPLDYTHLPYWDLCAALRFICLFGDNLAEAGAFFIPFGRDDISEQVIRENVGYFIGHALALLDA